MKDQEGEIRIYAACLAAYNNAILHGCWINAEQDADDIRDAITKILKASPIKGAEEWAIHDYEGFEGVFLSEYSGIDYVADLAGFISEHGELGAKLVEYFDDLETARTAISDDYAGHYASLAEFAQETTESYEKIPQSLEYYIDWERMGKDLAINDVLAIETGFASVHVFWRQ